MAKIAKPLYIPVLLLLGGCGRMFLWSNLAGYDRDISSSTRAIENARDDAHRAEAYTKRGEAYAEKARYGRTFKLIAPDEYARLFGLAIKDHDRAIALNPGSAAAYFSRGQTYYNRAVLEVMVNGVLVGSPASRKVWFDPAAADLRKAVERDARHSLAWDGLGLIDESTGELDQAISDYTQEMALTPLGRTRVADAYCTRGSSNQKENKYDAAIADYEKSIDTGASAVGCMCDPYNPLLGLYEKDQRYDQVWEVVGKARRGGKWIAPDLLANVEKESGRRE
jgi:tetratricopeptide (TPR) repeat protein